jgi:hypothetical protein
MIRRLNRRGWSAGIATVLGAAVAATAGRPLVAVGAAVAIAVLLCTSLTAKVLIYFAALPLVGFAVIHVPGAHAKLAIGALAMLPLVQLAAERLLRRRRRLLPPDPLVYGVVAFGAIVVASSFTPVARSLQLGVTQTRVYLVPMSLFVVGLAFFSGGDRNVRWFLKLNVVMGGVAGAYMLWQLVVGFPPAEVLYFGGRLGRVIGEKKLFSTFPGPEAFGFAAAYFTLACIVARNARIWPRATLVVGVVSALGTLTSGARIAMVALAVALPLVVIPGLRERGAAWTSLRVLAAGAAGFVLLASAVLLTPVASSRNQVLAASNGVQAQIQKFALLKEGTADPDLGDRIARAHHFGSFIVSHPIGAGTGVVTLVSIDPNQPPPSVTIPAYLLANPYLFAHDSAIFSMGAELGLVGLALYVVLLVAAAARAHVRRKLSDDPLHRAVLALTTATAVLILVIDLTNEAFRLPEVAAYVWFLLAAPVALPQPGRSPTAATAL